MPVPHKFQLGSRFYIYSHNPMSPFNRPPLTPSNLIVMAHGKATPNDFIVRDVQQVRFWAQFNVPADVEEIEDELNAFNRANWPTDAGRRYNIGAQCPDYVLKKEIGRKPWRGCCCCAAEPTSDFADTSYINQIMNLHQLNYDVVGLHNHFYTGRTILFSQLVSELADRLAGHYSHLLCAFCREAA
jgi:hypothetical protein